MLNLRNVRCSIGLLLAISTSWLLFGATSRPASNAAMAISELQRSDRGLPNPPSHALSKRPSKPPSSPSSRRPAAIARLPVMVGLYTQGFAGDQRVIDEELRAIDQWTGRQTSLAGAFMDIEDSNPAYNVPTLLGRLHQNGYTAFINLKSHRTAAEIARGDLDVPLRQIAQSYAVWARAGKDRMAFIAPLQEMNIPGETYAQDPPNFKLAYHRIQRIFEEQGVARRQVKWVFAPNGWSMPEHAFERYYPGGDRVDVVAFSGYNWGYCPRASWKQWQGPKAVFEPYLQRLAAMAPQKPIFIAQTATVSDTKLGTNASAKNQWLRESYAYLAANSGVAAILYFNLRKECDWELRDGATGYVEGYKEAVRTPAFGYVAPADVVRMYFGE